MAYHLADHLFQSRTRSAVLHLLFVNELCCSVSELARRTGLSPRVVATEVRHLGQAGLAAVEVVGGADLVRANLEHEAATALRQLLTIESKPPSSDAHVRASLVAWGAPLDAVKKRGRMPLGDTLLAGLEVARRDATILRVLPTVLARNVDAIDWVDLKEAARRRKLKAELGWLVELTGSLLGRDDLGPHVMELRDRRRRMRFYPEVASSFEEELARKRTPPRALAWGFWMNMPDEVFKSTLERHA